MNVFYATNVLLKKGFFMQKILAISVLSTVVLAQTYDQGTTVPQLNEIKSADKLKLKIDTKKPKAVKSSPIANAASIKFKLKGIKLLGNKSIPSSEIMKIFADVINKKITVKELQSIVNKVSELYLAKGFILSHAYIPPQEAKDGIIKIKLVEGYVKGFKLVGKLDEENNNKIRHLLKPISKEKPLRSQTLENAIYTINQIPGVRSKSLLSPNKDQKHAAILTIMSKFKDSSMDVGMDNYINKLDGSARLSANVENYSVITGGKIGLKYGQTINPEKSKYFTANTKMPLFYNGDFLDVNYTSVRNKPNYLAIGINTVNDTGNSKIWNFLVTHPIKQTRHFSQNLIFNISRNNTNLIDSTNNSMKFDDTITSMRIGSIWTYLGRNNAQNYLSFTWSRGLPALGADNTLPSRPGGNLKYSKINMEFEGTKSITRQLQATVNVSAQKSYNRLLSSEEFSFGGKYCGIGYDAGEMMGDDGYCVHKQINLLLPNANKFGLQRWYGFAFHDKGEVRNKTFPTLNTPSSQKDKDFASSFGLGLNIKFNGNMQAQVLYALPLDKDVALENNRKGRVFFTFQLRD